MSVTIDDLAAELGKILDTYSEEAVKAMKKAVDKTATETNKEIKANVEFNNRTGKYLKSFATKTTYESTFSKVKTWYVKAPHYRLTHLLEHGHATRNGGRTRAYPHISKGEEYAEKRLTALLEELLDAIS